MLTCVYCGQEADPEDPKTWVQVKVWVHGPKRDGSKLREDTGEAMHDECMKKHEAGIAPDMEPMF